VLAVGKPANFCGKAPRPIFKEDHLNPELSQLISLQDVDVEIKRIKAEIESLPAKREELESQFAAENKEFLDIKQQLDAALTQKSKLEEEIDSEQQKLEKFKTDQMKATNEREYSTSVREIDTAKKTISTLETELLKLMEQVEKLDAQVKERSPEIETKRIEMERQLTEYTALAKADAEKLEKLLVERTPMVETLSPETRSTYDRMSKIKSGLALSEALDYKCLACRMTIRPQVFNDIRRGENLITCENCGRILFFRG
jgi:predicted  nucleic acid-binding Zn-ribbon protein